MSKYLKKLGEIYKLQQDSGADCTPCPRCGKDNMKHECVKNALSRRANVYICSDCGTSEAIEDIPSDKISIKKLEIKNWAFSSIVEDEND